MLYISCYNMTRRVVPDSDRKAAFESLRAMIGACILDVTRTNANNPDPEDRGKRTGALVKRIGHVLRDVHDQVVHDKGTRADVMAFRGLIVGR